MTWRYLVGVNSSSYSTVSSEENSDSTRFPSASALYDIVTCGTRSAGRQYTEAVKLSFGMSVCGYPNIAVQTSRLSVRTVLLTRI